MENSRIQWTDHTWSPWEGCTKVSEGCAHCYAEARNHRFGSDNWGKGKARRKTKNWGQLFKWNRQAENEGKTLSVFPSLCDPFDYEVSIGWFCDLLSFIPATPHLRYLLLTKRPENVIDRLLLAKRISAGSSFFFLDNWIHGQPPLNVWLGTSCENQATAGSRIPILHTIPAAKRFISFEPLLGPIEGVAIDDFPRIDWAIIGGESGRGARPCNIEWIRSLKDQCRMAGIAPFVKQLGSNPVMEPGPVTWPTEDPKGGDMSEWPEDLRVREIPA